MILVSCPFEISSIEIQCEGGLFYGMRLAPCGKNNRGKTGQPCGNEAQ